MTGRGAAVIFADRHDAGRLLGERLADLRLKRPVMLARCRVEG